MPELIKELLMSHKLTKEQVQSAVALIEAISADPNAEDFLEPVPWKELELFDYPQIIKNPMDLGTVKSKLLGGEFENFDEFLAHIQLIWDNCKTYNMAGSEIYKICERMERTSRREISKFRNQVGLPSQTTQPSSSVKKSSVAVKSDEAALQEVTSEMKKDFCLRIKKLPAESLTKFVQKVQQSQANSVAETGQDNI